MRGHDLQIAYGLNKKRASCGGETRTLITQAMAVPDNFLGLFRTSDFCQTSANGFSGGGGGNGENE
jgi:hypothetical protein